MGRAILQPIRPIVMDRIYSLLLQKIRFGVSLGIFGYQLVTCVQVHKLLFVFF
jgi:hypothetical protein